MSATSFFIIKSLAYSSLLGLGAALILLASLLLGNTEWGKNIHDIVRRKYYAFALLVSFIATVGSLLLSEVIGFEPCFLCWYQRIMMYPQVFLLLVAMRIKD